VWVPEHLGVVVRVQVDEAGRDDQPARVQHPVGLAAPDRADVGDAAVLDAHVGDVARRAQAVEDRASLDDGIELGHGSAPFSVFASGWPYPVPHTPGRQALCLSPCRSMSYAVDTPHSGREASWISSCSRTKKRFAKKYAIGSRG